MEFDGKKMRGSYDWPMPNFMTVARERNTYTYTLSIFSTNFQITFTNFLNNELLYI